MAELDPFKTESPKKNLPGRDLPERNLRIALGSSQGIPYPALCRLAACLPTWCDADLSRITGLAAEVGLPKRALRRALELRSMADSLARRQERLAEKHDCRLLVPGDPEYPRPLHDLALPPPLLYCRGKIPKGPAVAMVGSRAMDAYGREVATVFSRGLAQAGVTVISGFARGIDAICHRGAMDAPVGKTLAVHGCGLDLDYPSGQRRLAEQIAMRGASLSEFPFGREPRAWHFPVRNRLIAALAEATLVIQAAGRSGSLNTAHHALELGRDVFAVPGRVTDPLAQGTNGLIADGALVARTPEDVLDGLCLARIASAGAELETAEPTPPLPKGPAGQILEHLPAGSPRSAEDLAAACDKPIDRVLALLLELELGGWIRREPGPVYVR